MERRLERTLGMFIAVQNAAPSVQVGAADTAVALFVEPLGFFLPLLRHALHMPARVMVAKWPWKP